MKPRTRGSEREEEVKREREREREREEAVSVQAVFSYRNIGFHSRREEVE